jgi:hypothetical protein
MEEKPVVALMYDFDKTLSPRDTQEYAFIPEIGMESTSFWDECAKTMRENNMDQILAYMYVMYAKARNKMVLTRDVFHAQGRKVQLFPGVPSWFARVNRYAAQKGLAVEHYIISSGLKEIIEGTKIAQQFKMIYASEFLYDQGGVAVWPAMTVNFTSKTQFLFRINKGVLDITENNLLNQYTPQNKRRIPFTHMIYIGDGLTDIPCMKLTKFNGGHSIAVYQGERSQQANEWLLDERVDFAVPADYQKGSSLEQIVLSILDQIASYSAGNAAHSRQMDEAQAANLRERPAPPSQRKKAK